MTDAAAPQRTAPIKVAYILGWGRSGSTLLDNILGQLDGFFSAGELHYLWDRGLLQDRSCGCGTSLRDCEVWSRVIKELNASVGRDLDPSEMADLQERTVRNRHTPALLGWARRDRTNAGDIARYGEITSKLYQAIARVTGSKVIVDSSKRIPRAALLTQLPNIDTYLIHLIRDPRAVAYSWSRSKPQSDGGRPEMVRFGPVASTVRWNLWTAGGEVVRRRIPERSMAVSYERFVEAPREVVGEILALLGEPPVELPFSGPHTVTLKPTHTVSGNPSRFSTGETTLRADDEWRRRQPSSDRRLATVIASPLLRRYGYRLRARGPR